MPWPWHGVTSPLPKLSHTKKKKRDGIVVKGYKSTKQREKHLVIHIEPLSFENI